MHHNLDLSSRSLSPFQYKFNRNPPTTKFGLHDKMVSYFDGYDRKIIPLAVCLAYPIIYDVYLDETSQSYDMTVAVCPFTLASAVFHGKYYATDVVDRSCLVISNGHDKFPIANAHITDMVQSNQPDTIKKYEVDIKILRNIFTEYPDCKYLVINDDVPTDGILDPNYYENGAIMFKTTEVPKQIHMKTLVYLIQYTSAKDKSIKTTVIVGEGANAAKPTGYNVVKSKVYDYLTKSDEKIKEKFGFILPIMWFAWKSFFPDARVLYLS